MKCNVYSVFDIVGGNFLHPQNYTCHGNAIRAFGDMVRNPKSAFNAHPFDFHLYFLGEFDDYSAKFDCVPVPVLLSRAVEHLPSTVSAPVPDLFSEGNGVHKEPVPCK